MAWFAFAMLTLRYVRRGIIVGITGLMCRHGATARTCDMNCRGPAILQLPLAVKVAVSPEVAVALTPSRHPHSSCQAMLQS